MNRYFEDMVLSASPVELTGLLYQKAIDSTRNAREHLKNGRIAERCAAITNVYLILAELTASLRTEEAPDLAPKLASLYHYMQSRLLEANMAQQDQPLADVLNMLITLAEPWAEMGKAPLRAPNPWSAAAAISDESARIAYSA